MFLWIQVCILWILTPACLVAEKKLKEAFIQKHKKSRSCLLDALKIWCWVMESLKSYPLRLVHSAFKLPTQESACPSNCGQHEVTPSCQHEVIRRAVMNTVNNIV